jgi:hypothetical protein
LLFFPSSKMEEKSRDFLFVHLDKVSFFGFIVMSFLSASHVA